MSPYIYSRRAKKQAFEQKSGSFLRAVLKAEINSIIGLALVVFFAGSVLTMSLVATAEISQGVDSVRLALIYPEKHVSLLKKAPQVLGETTTNLPEVRILSKTSGANIEGGRANFKSLSFRYAGYNDQNNKWALVVSWERNLLNLGRVAIFKLNSTSAEIVYNIPGQGTKTTEYILNSNSTYRIVFYKDQTSTSNRSLGTVVIQTPDNLITQTQTCSPATVTCNGRSVQLVYPACSVPANCQNSTPTNTNILANKELTATAGQAFSAIFSVMPQVDASGQVITYSINANIDPPLGLRFDRDVCVGITGSCPYDSRNSLRLSGTPRNTAALEYSFTITASTSTVPPFSRNFKLNIAPDRAVGGNVNVQTIPFAILNTTSPSPWYKGNSLSYQVQYTAAEDFGAVDVLLCADVRGNEVCDVNNSANYQIGVQINALPIAGSEPARNYSFNIDSNPSGRQIADGAYKIKILGRGANVGRNVLSSFAIAISNKPSSATPSGAVSRGEAAKRLVEGLALGCPSSGGCGNVFSNTANLDADTINAMNILYANQITGGCSYDPNTQARSFCQNDAILRWQFVVFLGKILEKKGYNLGDVTSPLYFSDMQNSSHPAYKYAQILGKMGIISGYNNPNGGIAFYSDVGLSAADLGPAITAAKNLLTTQSLNTNNQNNQKINVAASANGGRATASSVFNGYSPEGTIDGDITGGSWGHNGGWNDNTYRQQPDWLEVTFDGQKTINEVNVITLADNYYIGPTPTTDTTFGNFGITAFDVQYWNGSSWVTKPEVVVTGNNKVLKNVKFNQAVTTNKIRISINSALQDYSRIVEVQAY